jgi:uncharacterized coiled-coil protein SlyX/rubredoxin
MDLTINAIKEVIAVATQAGAASTTIARGIADLKSLFNVAEPGTNADIKATIAALTEQIAESQLANAKLKVKLAALHEEMMREKNFETELNRYELWESPLGATVYRIKAQAQGAEPVHYICPSCAIDKKKSILQGHKLWRECPVCKTGFRFQQSDVDHLVPVDRTIR